MLYPGNRYFTSEKDQREPPFFIKQTIGNACGTVALLHALCNNTESGDNQETRVERGSFIDKYVSNFRNGTPMERADFLYEDVSVEENHQKMAQVSDVP